MAGRAKQPWYLRSHRGVAQVDFMLAGERIRRSLELPYHPKRSSKAEARAAYEAAARYYSDHVAGRVVSSRDSRVMTAATLEEATALWLDAIETPATKGRCDTFAVYGRHWAGFASDDSMRSDGVLRWEGSRLTPFERFVSDEGPEDYAVTRLALVLRETVRKELVAMFGFFRWLKLRKYISEIPPRPSLPSSDPGVHAGKQRRAPVPLTAPQASAIVAQLPEWSNTGKRRPDERFRVRVWGEFLWETGLRPSTVERLSVPQNYVKGSTTITLAGADDKARYGRVVPLSARAQTILAELAPAAGLIFGRHDYRKFLKAAAKKVLTASSAPSFAAYDFRHGRALDLLETSGNLPGVAYQLGHKQLTTTNRYLKAQQRQGAAVMAAADAAVALDEEAPDGGPSEADSVTILSPQPTDLPENPSGREDSNLRPLDPQGTGPGPFTEEYSDSGSDGDHQKPAESITPDPHFVSILSPLTDAARALAVEVAVWEAFDILSAEEWSATPPLDAERRAK